MKRSEINEILRDAAAFIRSFGYVLPPFANLSPQALRDSDHALIKSRAMGWDVTDFARGEFDKRGLFLFTTRNGETTDLARGRGMLYAEKIMISRVSQLCPMHRHDLKAEDIINRGGGDLIIRLFAAQPDGSIDREADISVPSDGRMITLPAGGELRLAPGESVTLMPGVWHAFWGARADVLVGEVSTVNDDLSDNVFEEPLDRFADIEEDEAPWRLLVSDYATLL